MIVFVPQEFLTAVKQEGLVSETVLASTEQETNNVWAVRKNISVALSTKGEHLLCIWVPRSFQLADTSPKM